MSNLMQIFGPILELDPHPDDWYGGSVDSESKVATDGKIAVRRDLDLDEEARQLLDRMEEIHTGRSVKPDIVEGVFQSHVEHWEEGHRAFVRDVVEVDTDYADHIAEIRYEPESGRLETAYVEANRLRLVQFTSRANEIRVHPERPKILAVMLGTEDGPTGLIMPLRPKEIEPDVRRAASG